MRRIAASRIDRSDMRSHVSKNPHAVSLGRLGGHAGKGSRKPGAGRKPVCHPDRPDIHCSRCRKRLKMQEYRTAKLNT